jgi:sugar transferase (PEP-CTERM system associated)
MATATFDNTAWTGASASPGRAQLEVRAHRLARPRGAFLAAELTVLSLASLQFAWGGHNPGALILIASCLFFFHVNHIDRSIVTSKSLQLCIDVAASLGMGFLASAWLFYLVPGLVPPAGAALTAGLLIGLLPVILRLSLRHLMARGKCVEEILIVGTGDLPAKLHRVLGDGAGCSERNAHVVSVSEGLADLGAAIDLTELKELVARDQIERVVIADLDTRSRESLASALLDSRLRGLQVNDAVEFYEELSGKIWVEALNPQWFVYTNGFDFSPAGASLKRCFDVAFALLMILLAAPLLLLIAVAIKLESAGPVIFRQVRVGLHGKTFVLYKFRSMRYDAELETGPAWAGDCDPRVTRLGRLLRAFRLDELPQAFNVLKGDMSMVGPRPERPCFVSVLEREIPFYNLRHYLKPGITGWAQVMFKYGASVEDSYEKLQYDFYYAKHKSLRCDVEIILKTVGIVLLGHGK